MLYFFLVVGLIGLALIAAAGQKRWPRLRRLAAGLLISYVTVLLLLGAGELYFRYGYADSENIITLATVNWLNRYWHTNALGFRDREWTAADLAGKQTVLVLGDSFAAGWGIQDPADRFPDALARRLGDGYAVINLAVYGSATPEQLDTLKQYPLVKKPDVVLLQYFLNDINYAGLKLGLLPNPAPTPAWVNQTYLGNFVYWRFLHSSLANAQQFQDWWAWSYGAYDNVGIWSVHKQEIEDFIQYVDGTGARLIVVIFPNMLDPTRSVPYVDRVAQVFQARGHPDVLKLFDAVAAWRSPDLMVSPRDSHPSPAFHRYVADLLYQQFFARG
jgi:hypothetical protein